MSEQSPPSPLDEAKNLRQAYQDAVESGDEQAMKAALWDAHVHYKDNEIEYVRSAKVEMHIPDQHDKNAANIGKVYASFVRPKDKNSLPVMPEVRLSLGTGSTETATGGDVLNLSSRTTIGLVGVARIAFNPSVIISEHSPSGQTRVWAIETYSTGEAMDWTYSLEENEPGKLADATYVYELDPGIIDQCTEAGGMLDVIDGVPGPNTPVIQTGRIDDDGSLMSGFTFDGDPVKIQHYLKLIAENLPPEQQATA